MQDSATNPFIPQETKQIQRKTEELHSPLKRIASIIAITTGVLTLLIAIGLVIVVPRSSAVDQKGRVDLANILQPPGQLSRLVPVASTLGFSIKYDNQLLQSYAETVPVGGAAPNYYQNDDLRTVRDYDLVRLTPTVNSLSNNDAVADAPDLEISAQTTQAQLAAATAEAKYNGLSQLSVFVQMNVDQIKAARTTADGSIVSINATNPTTRTVNGVSYQYVRFSTQNDNDRISNQKYEDCYYTIQNNQAVSACINNVRPNNIDAASLDEKALQTLSFQAPEKPSDSMTPLASGTTASSPASSSASSSASASVPAPSATSSNSAKTPAHSSSSTSSSAAATAPQSGMAASSSQAPAAGQQNDLITQTPEYNNDGASLESIAKNQPSVIRIGTLYCGDLQLKLIDGTTATTLTDACAGALSSGTFVSSNGLIATTGDSVRFNPRAAINGYINFASSQVDLQNRLKRVLNYLLTAKIIQQSDADYMTTGVQTSNSEALAKIEDIGSLIPDSYITPTNESYSYAAQLGNQPITVNDNGGGRQSFAFSDTVVQAKYVASDFDSSKALQYTFNAAKPNPNVGLIQISGTTQNVPVISGDNNKSGNRLNTIGLPTSVASDLNISSWQNEPTVTGMTINQVFSQSGHPLMSVNNPIIPGMNGAGTFDQSGNLIGFAVYGLSYCPDQQCVASGTIRSSGELLNLIADKNMQLGSLSNASVTWRKGVDEYFKANYAAASSDFSQAGSLNPRNQFAATLAKLAQSKVGSAHDTSLLNRLTSIMITVIIIMIVLTVGSAGLYLLQKRNLDRLRVGHYGMPQPAPQQPPMPQVYNSPQPQNGVMPQPVPLYQQQTPVAGYAPVPTGYQQPQPVVTQQVPTTAPAVPQGTQVYQPQPYQPPITPQPSPAAPQPPAMSTMPPQQSQPPVDDPFYHR